MEEQGHLGAIKLEHLRQAIREGLNSGEPTPWDAEEIKRESRNGRTAKTNANPTTWMPIIIKRPRSNRPG